MDLNVLDEGQLRFSFAAANLACNYDAWSFYRNQFKDGCGKDNKAVDIVARIEDTTWLIEVKDDSQHQRSKNMRVVFDLEQPHKPSRLRPRSIEPDKLQLKLKSLTRAIDPHPLVVDMASCTPQVVWQVSTVTGITP